MGKNEKLKRGRGASALLRGLRAPEKRAPVGFSERPHVRGHIRHERVAGRTG
jgi:hypothetical protein